MKNKIIISLVACFITAGSFVHYNFSQNIYNNDISLADISVMAQADGESGHSATYECYDAQTYTDVQYEGALYYRVCENTKCGYAYFVEWGQIAECTVYY